MISPMNKDTDRANLSETTVMELTTSTKVHRQDDIWHDIKTFFNPQNSMILLAILCLILFSLTLCLVCVVLQLWKKKRSNTNPTKPSAPDYPKYDSHRHFPSSPMQMGLTSNQIASMGNILPTNRESPQTGVLTGSNVLPISAPDSNKTQSFDNFESELKRTWLDKGISSSNTTHPSLANDDEVETVNEVLGMEERSGKVYYKVNFTGHPADYTAWVCEEDLIPE